MLDRILTSIKDKFIAGIKYCTFTFSKWTTAIVLVLGSLVGFHTTDGELTASRLVLAFIIFVFGAPIGLMLFGQAMNMIIWFSIVVTVLFMMNLHATWEVIRSLKNGGLDYVMVDQAVTSINIIVPSESAIEELNHRIASVNSRYRSMTSKHKGFDGNILTPLKIVPALEN